MASFFKEENDKVIFTGDGELIYFVPEKYFDTNAAVSIGEVIEFMGVCSYGLFDNSGKKIKIGRLKCPTMIQCNPSSISKESEYHLEGTKEPSDYRLLHFKKGDELICNINLPADIVNVEIFIKLFTSGNLPDNIPYNELYDYIIKNANLNKFNYKVSCQIIGILISEIYRDSKDLYKPFRLSNMESMTDYKAISIKKVPKYTSAYTAITSENADESIAASMTSKGMANTPLEKVVMGD